MEMAKTHFGVRQFPAREAYMILVTDSILITSHPLNSGWELSWIAGSVRILHLGEYLVIKSI